MQKAFFIAAIAITTTTAAAQEKPWPLDIPMLCARPLIVRCGEQLKPNSDAFAVEMCRLEALKMSKKVSDFVACLQEDQRRTERDASEAVRTLQCYIEHGGRVAGSDCKDRKPATPAGGQRS